MGAYINPENESKEDFLEREGKKIHWDMKPSWETIPYGYLPVVLVNNPLFTAAAIGFNKREYEFLTRHDTRERELFFVKIDKLWDVSNLKDYVKNMEEAFANMEEAFAEYEKFFAALKSFTKYHNRMLKFNCMFFIGNLVLMVLCVRVLVA